MPTKTIDLHTKTKIRVEYHTGADSVHYTYIDSGDESLPTQDLLNLLAEEDSSLGSRGITTVAIKVLQIVNSWLGKINANKSN
jgi:hypothetical protein